MDHGELASLAESLLKKAKKQVDSAEVFIQYGHGSGVSIKNGSLESSSGGDEFGIGMRVISGGRLGFSYTNPKDPEKAIALAKKISKLSTKTGYSFFHKSSYPNVTGLFDKKVYDLEPAKAIGYAKDMISSCQDFKKGTKVTGGGLGWSYGADIVANTEGLLAMSDGTSISGGVSARYEAKSGPATGSWDEDSRHDDIDFALVGETAAMHAYDSRDPKPLPKSGTMPVVFGNEAGMEILEFTVIPSLYGVNMKRGESVYAGQMGNAVCDSGLSLYDDPLDPKGDLSGICDEEGVPSQRTMLIEKGVIKGALYDTHNAFKYKAEPTSSGLRAQWLQDGTSYRAQPITGARNFTLKGKAVGGKDEVVSKVDSGILVREVMGAHTANPTSSDFSVMASTLFLIKNGAIEHSLKSLMVSGNAAKMLKEVIAIGSDHRHMGGALSCIGTCIPTMAVGGLNVTP